MRIGTWNLAGRWTAAHADVLASAACDIWLLTEVRNDVPGQIATSGPMNTEKAYAAIVTPGRCTRVESPHEASAAVLVDGVLVCCSILPWRASASVWPDAGTTIGERTAAAVARIRRGLGEHRPIIWGGDWNNSLVAPNRAGTTAGLAAIGELVRDLRLVVPTAQLPHRLPGVSSIDHIALPEEWSIVKAERLSVAALSDHDVYVVET